MSISKLYVFVLVAVLAHTLPAQDAVDFTRDVQPILADKCWKCHGVDAQSRQADLRLDLRDPALESKAIVPGQPAASSLVKRILSQEDDQRMPPPESKKSLSPAEIAVLTKWVEQGALYTKHWAFEKPKKTTVPKPSRPDWVQDPIDAFVLARLDQQGWAPAGQADRATLLRRLSLDLTGLPPTLEELNRFLSDQSPTAYEQQVDRLLSSRRYAERMAIEWLDAARYADTNGYNNDEDRTMWPWRDWVIDAFDRNMPYDQFIVEQLAGDLLPNASLSQKVATAFHRNLGHNTEGGIIQEEYRVEYVADRVHTTATIFMGLSMQCARCHDHKYDPISQREYYQFYAFFNRMEEKQGSYSRFRAAEPFVTVPSAADRVELEYLDKRRQLTIDTLAQIEPQAEGLLKDWLHRTPVKERQALLGRGLLHRLTMDELDLRTIGEKPSDASRDASRVKFHGSPKNVEGKLNKAIALGGDSHLELSEFSPLDGQTPFSISVWVSPTSNETLAVLSKMDQSAAYRGFDLLLDGGKVSMHLIDTWPDNGLKVVSKSKLKLNAWQHLLVTYDGRRSAKGVHIYLDGQPLELEIAADKLTGTIDTSKPFRVGLRDQSHAFQGAIDELQVYGYPLSSADAKQLFSELKPLEHLEQFSRSVDQLDANQLDSMKRIYLERVDPLYPKLKAQLVEIDVEKKNVESRIPAVSIMSEMEKPRETFVLKRGAYDQPGDKVDADVPTALPPLDVAAPRNRLGLATWLVAPDHPLTARVAVNRWWQLLFGQGLVRTAEDFGVTGSPPSHPELLDYLATELVDSKWNVKQLMKRMVMSATYRQDSRLDAKHLELDPENRLLARGARFRLPAEMIRDNALAISGLLSDRIGGPSVKPYQPEGLWEDVTVERRGRYVLDQGEDLYRRSMYTFWKRTCPPPAMMSFDAPNREVCLARRARTNTPLQSLILMNDPTYVEAARKLAERMLRSGGDNIDQRIVSGYRMALSRDPLSAELEIMRQLVDQFQNRFKAAPESASQLLVVGQSPSDATFAPTDLATWTMIASTLLNLDETITRK